MQFGHKNWFIPDMYLPEPYTRSVPGHETVSMMNAQKTDAHVKLTAIFEDNRNPVVIDNICVKSMKSLHFRMDRQQEWKEHIPVKTPYSLIIESDLEIIAEYARLNWVDGEATVFGVMAYPV